MFWRIGEELLEVLVDAAAQLDDADSRGLVRPALVGVGDRGHPLRIVREATVILIVGVIVTVVLGKGRGSEKGQKFYFFLLFSYRKI